jgi:hypothetical protein
MKLPRLTLQTRTSWCAKLVELHNVSRVVSTVEAAQPTPRQATAVRRGILEPHAAGYYPKGKRLGFRFVSLTKPSLASFMRSNRYLH